MIMLVALISISGFAQEQGGSSTLEQLVAKLDSVTTVADYEALEAQFATLSETDEQWLSPYYAALCDANIGFLLEKEGERIEPYSDRGLEQLKEARARIDTATQRKELAEVYVVASLLYRTKVFINPMTMGPKYGPTAGKYLELALNLEADNPRAIYVDAWNKYHTPKAWGGDKGLARQLAQKSLALLAKEPQGVHPHWGIRENKELLND
ncbi:hypothetical protein GCM10011386_02340 [Parapedobacter defluvii]|uniref:Uncharacterized protein n=2 Tax=Parapedobacter defluvii TaxID=2045106 RepID=A0ABQ1L0X8_9SPHI|nr:hypothetical protein GCM10011386_02340 [Parapedobacter defluvii]